MPLVELPPEAEPEPPRCNRNYNGQTCRSVCMRDRNQRCVDFGGEPATVPAFESASLVRDDWDRSEDDEDDESDRNPNTYGHLYSYHGYELPRRGYFVASSDRKRIVPVTRHWRTPDRRMYFGVENELSFTDRRAMRETVKARCADSDIWTAAEDGSLVYDYSAEFISDPMTLAAWRVYLANSGNWNGAASHDGYGLHVHVSRAALSNLTIAKLDFAMYEFREYLPKLGRRELTHYCRAKNDMPSPGDAWRPDERHMMLNLTNEATIEFRFARSTTRADLMLATIELYAALIEWCRITSLRLIGHSRSEPADAGWNRFIKWVDAPAQRKYYVALWQQMAREGMVASHAKPNRKAA